MSGVAGASEVRSLDVPVDDLQVRGRRIEGYAARFGEESQDLGGWSEVLEAGAFADVLAGSPDVLATWHHDPSQVLGRTTAGTLRIEERGDGLWFSCDLPDSPLGQNVREAVRRGDAAGASFRFKVGAHRWDGTVRRVAKVASLLDVSVTPSPAYAGPRVELRSQPGETTPPDGGEEGTAVKVEDRNTPEGGGLKVEERSASAGPSVEERVLDHFRGLRKGEARSLTTAGGSAGPVTPPELSTFLWDKLRAHSIALASGIRVIPTDSSEVKWPRLTTDVAPDFYAEGDTIVAGDPAFDTLTAKPRKIAHRVEMSNESIDDSDPSLTGVLQDHLAVMIALKLDHAVFYGSGTPPAIKGMVNVSGIQTVSMGTDGAALANLDPFIDAIGLLLSANVPPPYAIAMAPRTFTHLGKLKEATGSVRPLLAEPEDGQPQRIRGLPVFVSSLFPVNETQGTSSNASSAFVFAPAQVAVVRRTDVEIEWDRSRLFDSDESEVRGKVRADFLAPNPAAIVRVRGIVPPS